MSDIDTTRLLAALQELSKAFVNGEQERYGMRIPAEPYRDGDLVCGGAYRLIIQLTDQVTDLTGKMDDYEHALRTIVGGKDENGRMICSAEMMDVAQGVLAQGAQS